MRPNRTRARWLIGSLAALLGASSAGRAVAEPSKSRTLTFAVGHLGQLDPAAMLTPQDERLVLGCFEGLTTLDPVKGQPVPAAAESWTTSSDGRTWTFKLRPVKWTKKFGDGVDAKEEVSAKDFVYAWLRLLDPDTRSPNAHILDVIPDARVLASESVRGAALDRIATAIQSGIGKDARTLKGEEVIAFLDDTTLEPRRWMSSIDSPAAREFLAWKDPNSPYQGAKAKKLLEVLRAESKRSIAATSDARAHLGVDRGFFAKDDKTLVVQVPGPSPWLPSLLARGPLVALRASWLEKKRENAFRQGAIFCNGPYLADSDLTRLMSGDEEKNLFKVYFHRNPNYWDPAAAKSDHVVCFVNETTDEILRQYDLGKIQWITASAFNPDDFARVLAMRAPGFKPKDKNPNDAGFAKITGDVYEAPGNGVCFVRIRCAPPFDKADARRAVASLIRPDELVKTWSRGSAPTTRRLTPSRVTGFSSPIRLPTFDPSTSRKLYGEKKRLEDWIIVAAEGTESTVADAIAKAVKGGVADDANTYVAAADDLRVRLAAGSWHLAVSIWQPAYDDPSALLSAFTSGNPVGGTLWSHATYDALMKASVDVATFVGAPDAALKDVASIKGPLAAASASNPESLETLRRALLAEAESILLDEAVVVPLWTTVERGVRRATVRGLPSEGKAGNVLDVISISRVTGED